MKKDWLFIDDDSICNFRVAGVLIRDGCLLVQRDIDGAEYALPGGHVQAGESSEGTLTREYREETGAAIVCERLIWVEECFWKWGKKDAHTLNFYYLISLKNDADIPSDYFAPQKDNSNVVLEWMPFDKLKDVTVYPEFLNDKIHCISDGIEHFVSR